MKITKPLIFLDAETTGTEPQSDRIITLCIEKIAHQGAAAERKVWKFNPGVPIPPESTEVHKITDEMVKDWPRLADYAQEIHDFIAGCDAAGFNTYFDLGILWHEFWRCGLKWDMAGMRVIDAGGIFKIKEPRGLEAAVKFYCNRSHSGAHDAEDDVIATRDVLCAQIVRYPELTEMDVAALAKFSQHDEERLDLAGLVVRNKDGVACYTHKKVRGVPVRSDPSYAEWICSRDFPEQSKMILRGLLEEIYQDEGGFEPAEEESLL